MVTASSCRYATRHMGRSTKWYQLKSRRTFHQGSDREAQAGPKGNSGTSEGIGGTAGAFQLSEAMTVIYLFVTCSKTRFSFRVTPVS